MNQTKSKSYSYFGLESPHPDLGGEPNGLFRHSLKTTWMCKVTAFVLVWRSDHILRPTDGEIHIIPKYLAETLEKQQWPQKNICEVFETQEVKLACSFSSVSCVVRVNTTFMVDASLSCNILISFCSPSPSVTTRDIACIRGNQSRLLFWNRRWRSRVCSLH